MSYTHYRTCNLCEAACGIAIEVEGERVLSIRGDENDRFSRGYICPKATALADVHHDPDRLRRPLRRTSTGWEELGWDEALGEVARQLGRIQREHGKNAVAVYQGNPTVHCLGLMTYGQLLMRRLGTRNRYSATSVDQLPHMLAALLMFGHQLLVPVPDVDRTDFFLVLGANPVVSNGSLMTAPDMRGRLRALRRRGGTLVVLDPRRTETAALASRHHFVRPGTDALVLLALLHTILAEDRARPGRLAAFTDGLDVIARLAGEFAPESVAAAVGMEAEDIRRLARDFASAPSAVCYGRVGVSTQEFGGLSTWLINVLNTLTGNLDRPGGAMFTTPAFDLVGASARMGEHGSYDRYRSRVRGLPEFGGEYPVATLADEIETPGPDQVRALLVSAGNPVLSTPNGARLERALGTLELMVSIDPYLNETSRHAHFVLPPTFALEHSHYDIALGVLSVRNVTRYSPPLFARAPEQRHDWEICLELATRMEPPRRRARGPLQRSAGRLGDRLLALAGRRLGPDAVVDLGLRLGPYGGLGKDALSLRKLAAATHGLDFGPLEPRLPERLYTANKRIQLAPDVLVADVARLRAHLDRLARAASSPGAGELSLIGRRQLRSNNSWLHNSERMVKGKARCTLLMHPADAAARELAAGDLVAITSRVGRVVAPVEISDEIMPGVVSLPHGWGHHRPGTRLRVAERHAGVSVNDVTDETFIDALSGTAGLSGVSVTVERAAGASAAATA